MKEAPKRPKNWKRSFCIWILNHPFCFSASCNLNWTDTWGQFIWQHISLHYIIIIIVYGIYVFSLSIFLFILARNKAVDPRMIPCHLETLTSTMWQTPVQIPVDYPIVWIASSYHLSASISGYKTSEFWPIFNWSCSYWSVLLSIRIIYFNDRPYVCNIINALRS